MSHVNTNGEMHDAHSIERQDECGTDGLHTLTSKTPPVSETTPPAMSEALDALELIKRWAEIEDDADGIDEYNKVRAALTAQGEVFQSHVADWMLKCFTPEIAADKLERGDRFLEEALELLQSVDYPRERVAALTDYVFNRPKGEPSQEAGGVMVTLAAFCGPHGLNMHEAGETELARINRPEIIEKIRTKQASKPTGSALPIATPQPPSAPAVPEGFKFPYQITFNAIADAVTWHEHKSFGISVEAFQKSFNAAMLAAAPKPEGGA